MLRVRGVSVWVDLFGRGEQGAAAVGVVTVAVSENSIQIMLVLCTVAPKFRRGLWLRAQMMILVDDASGVWPGINHAPWFGVTVADFVMPVFLFIIGVSAALVFKVVC